MSDSYRKLPEEDGDMPTNGSLTVGEEDSVRIIEEEYDGVDVASIRKIQRAMEVVSLDQDDDDAPSKKLDDILLEEDASLSKKLYVVTSIAVPVGASLFLWLIGNFITLGFAGRFPGTQDEKTVTFAGISLATVFYNVALLSIINGMATGIETLASHHNGAGDYRGVGLVLQRSMAVGAAFVIPMLPIVYFSGDLVLLVGIDPAVAKVFAKFIAVRALSCPADVFNESYRRYLTAMGLVNPTVAFAVVFNSLVLLMDFAFVRAGFSFECLAWSLVVCSYIGAGVMYLLSLRYDEVQRTLIPLDSGALTQWGTYISLGLPGLLMLCSEWWAYELLTFMAGMLGKESLAAQTIIVQTVTLTFMVPLGIGTATCSIVGNALGRGYSALAHSVTMISMGVFLCCWVVMAIAMLLCMQYLVRFFTDDPKVQQIALDVRTFFVIFMLLDGMQGVGSAVLRGCGKQKFGAVMNFVAFWVIGLPLAYVFCFHTGRRIEGLLQGIIFGTLFQCSVLVYLLTCGKKHIYPEEGVALLVDGVAAAELTVQKDTEMV